MIRVFTTQVCPKCRRLKQFLFDQGIDFEVMDMESPAGMAELFNASVFEFSAPVLQVESTYLTVKQMFKGVDLQEEFVLGVVNNGNRV